MMLDEVSETDVSGLPIAGDADTRKIGAEPFWGDDEGGNGERPRCSSDACVVMSEDEALG